MKDTNITKNLWETIWEFNKKIWPDESGYYYAEYKEDPNGKKRIVISEVTLIILIVCLTLLLLTVLVLTYKAGLLSQGITLLIILLMVGLEGVIVLIGKRKDVEVNFNLLLAVIALLCLVILGLNAKEINYLLKGFLSSLRELP
ncbi:MAG: hypothetical protein DRN08_07540 [Thermoplasmata archaeon]|nr:MAG: hypothetical protein DRN08_07540 [Thermoplasmata archaeon]